jgi:hypothetical protein
MDCLQDDRRPRRASRGKTLSELIRLALAGCPNGVRAVGEDTSVCMLPRPDSTLACAATGAAHPPPRALRNVRSAVVVAWRAFIVDAREQQ